MQLTGHDALSGSSFTQSFIVVAGHVAIVIAMTPGSHRHDGASAAQFILVMDGDDALLSFTVLVKGAEAHIVPFSPTAGGGHSHQHNIDLQSSVRVKFLVGI